MKRPEAASALIEKPSQARDCLRRATHAEHVRLNQHTLLSGITRRGYSLEFYVQVIVAYYHFYRAIEASIDEALARLQLTFDYGVRRKLPWLVEDLRHLGIDPDSPSARPSLAVKAPRGLDAGRLFGVLYTIEGSSLGGRVISEHLSANHGLTARSGARFFFGYGEAVDTCWREFTNELDRRLADGEARTLACGAARQTFTLMEQVLDDYAKRLRPLC